VFLCLPCFAATASQPRSTAAAGLFNAAGTFTTGTPFKGTLNSKNQMTVSVEGSKCELTYALKAVGKPAPIDAAAAAAEKPAATAVKASDSNATAAGPAAAAATPKKSAAATSSASALLAVLCAVLAFLL
jgi:hypothetical protein